MAISLLLLSVIVLIEATVLRHMVAASLVLAKSARRSDQTEPHEALLGRQVPIFRATLLNSSTPLTNRDFLGYSNALLFVSPAVLSSMQSPLLATLLNVFWNKVDGKLYLVCAADSATCRKLFGELAIEGSAAQLHIVVDEQMELARLFGATIMPSAFIVDEYGRVKKAGRPNLEAGGPVAAGNTSAVPLPVLAS